MPGIDVYEVDYAVLQGRAMLKQLEKRNDWDIVAIARGPVPALNSRAHFVSLDLKDKQAVEAKLREEKITGVTHVFHLAFAGKDHDLLCRSLYHALVQAQAGKWIYRLHMQGT